MKHGRQRVVVAWAPVLDIGIAQERDIQKPRFKVRMEWTRGHEDSR